MCAVASGNIEWFWSGYTIMSYCLPARLSARVISTVFWKWTLSSAVPWMISSRVRRSSSIRAKLIGELSS